MNRIPLGLLIALLILPAFPGYVWALASSNIPLDSPVYLYLDKLAGFGLITSDTKGIRPYSKAETARLLLEAEANLVKNEEQIPPLAFEFIKRIRELIPREASLREEPEKAPLVDYSPVASARLRYVYLDGKPRSYNRDVLDPANQSAFGFIGGNLRPQPPGVVHQSGTEGTPLVENNEGVAYGDGHNLEFRWSMEGYLGRYATVLVEPNALHTDETNRLSLQKGYLKLGSGGIELEVGRDANWFGPGYRGATTLTNNAANFDMVKLSSPEPVDVGWIKKYLGDFKYALIGSRFDATGSGADYRKPWFFGMKLTLKPKPWFEIGANLVRQEGGPGFTGDVSLFDQIFGGADNDHVNSIAGIDLRIRIPWLRNTEIYGEYSGEDSASFWPFVESYVAGIYIPCLTPSGRDDLRFEYYRGSVIHYTDWQFPAGYVYKGMTPGHSQGGAAEEFFVRYSHWFSARNSLALEYFHTERGQEGRLKVNSAGRYDPVNGVMQAVERKDALRAFWSLPFYGDVDLNVNYGWERISNVDLVPGNDRTNQLVTLALSYRY